MIIPKHAIKQFLSRERRDLRQYKRMTAAELEDAVAALPVVPPIWKRLRKHQKIGFLAAIDLRRVALFYDTGMGKTLMSMAIARYLRKASIGQRFLVLVPTRINKAEWAREIRKHSEHTSFCVLEGSSKAKLQQLRTTDATLVIETYPGLTHMCCGIEYDNKKERNRMRPDKKAVELVAQAIDGLILDEAHSIKNYKSLPFRICRALAKTCKTVLPLTGTPFGRDPQDLWSQMFIVDQGESLGATLGLYRAAFFKMKMNGWGVEYTFDEKKKSLLNRLLAHSAIRYEVKESDLPQAVRVPKRVALPEEANAYYQRARQAIIEARGDVSEMKNAFMRMRQISSGFVGFRNDETGARVEFEFDDNPKLEMLLSIIESVYEQHKAVVFTDFIYSGNRIARELKERKIGHAIIHGKEKHPDEALHAFNRDECRVLILSNAMATGLNLQAASYAIYYESPVSVIVRKQTERRVHRQESAHSHIVIYDLITEGTVDELILDYHKQGRDLFDAIVNGKAQI